MIHAIFSLLLIAAIGAFYGWGIPGIPYADMGRLVCMGSLVLIAAACGLYVLVWLGGQFRRMLGP